ncbi:hypothetical protein [Actinoplanes sp. GCM10030250]|uniref:hypothetical protein n=1 Tax=Actinoplanes sp. GCM10030250 TaxID=3273376 RepID=UPI00361425A2
MSGDALEQRVRALLDQTAQVFRGHERAETWLRRHRERLDEPLRVALTGSPRSGRSTLVNAFIAEDVAPVRAGGVPVWFHDGTRPAARVHPDTGPPLVTPLQREPRGGHLVAAPAGTRAIVVEWPCRALRHTRLLETTGDEAHTEADAILHLARHLGDDDLTPLQGARSGRGAAALPVHILVVLSRADELAGGRADALLNAKQIARRRRRDAHVAALCQDVLAVSGQMAYAGRTLREEEFAAIAAIAALPRAEADALLLSTDRFAGTALPAALPASVGATALAVGVPAERRAALLDRFGLGAIRLATTLTRNGARSRAALGEQLIRHSGLTDLQSSISDLFTTRRAVLKSRTALVALEQLLRAEDRPAAGHLIAELERLVATAHEFRELRLLAALRTGRVAPPADLAVEARRLIGGEGDAHCERLGMSPDSTAEQLWPAAENAAARWHEQTTAAATAGERRAAQVVLRSCTAILDDLG